MQQSFRMSAPIFSHDEQIFRDPRIPNSLLDYIPVHRVIVLSEEPFIIREVRRPAWELSEAFQLAEQHLMQKEDMQYMPPVVWEWPDPADAGSA